MTDASHQLLVPDLYVVSIPNPKKAGTPIKPWPGMEKLFIAEDCRRYTFVLTPEDYKSLPAAITEITPRQRHERGIRVEKGPRAYNRLLRLAVGLEDADVGKPAASVYVKPQWNVYQREYPERAAPFKKIIDWVYRDCRRVNAETDIAQIPVPSYDLATRRLMGIQKNKEDSNTDKVSVLLIADKEPITVSMIKMLTQTVGVDKLYITHPNPKELDGRWKEIEQKIKFNELSIKHSALEKIYFDDAMHMPDKFRHMVVCTPIGQYPDKDEAIINAWKKRAREDGLLIHRKGDPKQKQMTTPPWSEAGIENFRGVESLAAEYQAIIQENSHELDKGIASCRRLAVDKLARSVIEKDHPKQWRSKVRVSEGKPFRDRFN